jgi:hypothetical protein
VESHPLTTSAQDVPVLNNTLLNIDPLDVLGVMDAIDAHYQKLDDFSKWRISRSIKCLEIQDKQTLRMFKDLLVRAAIALKRQRVVVSDKDHKAIYLYSKFLVHRVDGFQGMARKWPNNTGLSFMYCSDHLQFLLQIHRQTNFRGLQRLKTETESCSQRIGQNG